MRKASFDRLTPVEKYELAAKRRRRNFFLLILFVLAVLAFWRFVPEVPERHTDIVDHFKYGSIGSDNTSRGLPYRVWRVLPKMFPEHLPATGGAGYEAFGLIAESSRHREQSRFVGFSKRRVKGVELLGLNCAICHTSTVRTNEVDPRIVVGMPANTVNLQGLFRFLFDCASDSRFTTKNVLDAIADDAPLSPVDRMLYKRVIPEFRHMVLAQKEKLVYWNDFADMGPGRIDTFGPYKALFFDLPPGKWAGTADFPSLWNQRPRIGMNLHWDGNNINVDERNISAAIGAGVTPETIEHEQLKRVADWIFDLQPPPFPEERIDQSLLANGKAHFQEHCADCHGLDGKSVGQVVPIDEVGTDPHRLNSLTDEFITNINTVGTGYPWRFKNFRRTNGYANSPLDGIWLRAPYLHNGSVPTLRHLLSKDRPARFYRGNDHYDWENVGFLWEESRQGGKTFYEFDTSKPGNGNGGHYYGVELEDNEKLELIEYMKTL